jgi:hypothetical protein
VLSAALAINTILFLVELAAGVAAGSASLQADALDFLADAANYGISLFVVGMALRYRASAALAKGATMGVFGVWVLGMTLWHVWHGTLPRAAVMGAIGGAALLANGICLALLWTSRHGDSNMRATWVCSRNDVIGNLAVLLAAVGVFGTGTGWPDVIVAAVMASLALHGAWQIMRLAVAEMGTGQHLGYMTTPSVRRMRRRSARPRGVGLVVGMILALPSLGGTAFGQTEDKESSAVIELGAAGQQSLKDGGSSVGPTVAVEVTPIEHWLELEAGVTSLFRHGTTEWDVDLLFKKPWTLSDKVEFMFGVGPEWAHAIAHGATTNSVGGESVLDFMFWPSAKHRFGWYLEPSYAYDFGRGHEQSLGVSGGLLIAIP